MMEGDCHLDQSLQKLLFSAFRLPPHVFPNLMRFEELLAIEQLNPTAVSIRIHANST